MPLGIEQSSFRQPLPAKLRPFVSKGYLLASGAPEPYEVIQYVPAGGLAATGSDIGKFMLAYLSQRGAILKPGTVRLMYDSTNDVLPLVDRMALGFFAEDRNGHRVRGHAGDTRLFHSHLWLFIDDGVGLFVSLNGPGREGGATALRSALLQGFADRYFPQDIAVGLRKRDVPSAARDARMIAGQYWSSYRSDTNFLRIENLFNQKTVVARDTEIRLIPDDSLSGGPRDWIEIAPLLWQASDTGALLEARVVNSRVERFATLPYAEYLPVPWALSSRWLLPTGKLALLIIALTALSWPVGAMMRAFYDVELEVPGGSRRSYHAVRGAALAVVLTMAAWAYVFIAGSANWSLLNGGFDRIVIALQVVTPITTIGLCLISAPSVGYGYRSPRGWRARAWATALTLSGLLVAYICFAFHLIGFGTNF
jgi:hypothetical protein